MKLKILFTTLLSIIVVRCSAQIALDTDGKNNLNNVYLYSLNEYCKSLDSVKTKIVYVRHDYFIGDSWPTKINSFEIKYLQDNEYKNEIQANGSSMTIVGISPLHFIKGNFYVQVIPFAASYKKKNVTLSNGGGLTVNFEYDQLRNGLIFKEKNWRGI